MRTVIQERALICDIKNKQALAPGLVRGIGDDCAVFTSLKKNSCTLITTDTLVDSVHFDRAFHPPELLGKKCLNVNVSDIAAMGARPRFALLSLTLPETIKKDWFDKWYDGFEKQLKAHDCRLIGGDTTSGKELVITVTLIGEAERDAIVYRNTAKVGDIVCVSGQLGSAAAGLLLLQRSMEGKREICANRYDDLLNAHLDPSPKIFLGEMLAVSKVVTAMQDISDGIATDLAHICSESVVGAIITEDCLPAHPQLENAAKELGVECLDLILRGGEDYQLLFTVEAGKKEFLDRFLLKNAAPPVICIGKIIDGSGVFLQTSSGEEEEISYQGYEHGCK